MKNKFSKILTKSFLIREYIKNKKSTNTIAEEIKNNATTIVNYLKKFGIPRRNYSEVKMGKDNPNFGNGNKIKGKNNPNFKGNKAITKQKYYCIKCKINEISYRCWKYGLKLCLKCAGKEHSKRMSGKNNSMFGKFGKDALRYIDGRTPLCKLIRHLPKSKQWRIKVFRRDGYTCQKCFKKGYLEAHHKNPFAELLSIFLQEYNQFSPSEDKETLVRLAIKWKPFWEVSNGQTLCKDCHKLTRKGIFGEFTEKSRIRVRYNSEMPVLGGF